MLRRLLTTLTLFLCFTASSFAQKQYVLLVNGGLNAENNNLRYLENIKSVYEGYRARGFQPEQFTVLYGDGTFENTKLTRLTPYTHERLNSSYVFGKDRVQVLPATPDEIDATLRNFSKLIQKGDILHIFLTDHGSDEEAGSICAWGGNYSADRLSLNLKQINSEAKILLTTNICYGGSLTKATAKNVCVAATQVPDQLNASQGKDLNVFAQTYGDALRGASAKTFGELFSEASFWDVKQNQSWTSIDKLYELNESTLNAQRNFAKYGEEQRFFSQYDQCSCLMEAGQLLQSCQVDLMKKYVYEFEIFDLARVQKERLAFMDKNLKKELKELATLFQPYSKRLNGLSHEFRSLKKQELALSKSKETQYSDWKMLFETLYVDAESLHYQLKRIPKFDLAKNFWKLDRLERFRKEMMIIKYAPPKVYEDYAAIKACETTEIRADLFEKH